MLFFCSLLEFQHMCVMWVMWVLSQVRKPWMDTEPLTLIKYWCTGNPFSRYIEHSSWWQQRPWRFQDVEVEWKNDVCVLIVTKSETWSVEPIIFSKTSQRKLGGWTLVEVNMIASTNSCSLSFFSIIPFILCFFVPSVNRKLVCCLMQKW